MTTQPAHGCATTHITNQPVPRHRRQPLGSPTSPMHATNCKTEQPASCSRRESQDKTGSRHWRGGAGEKVPPAGLHHQPQVWTRAVWGHTFTHSGRLSGFASVAS
eukprot:365766-Chlamydomonas_euryale.AAC.5